MKLAPRAPLTLRSFFLSLALLRSAHCQQVLLVTSKDIISYPTTLYSVGLFWEDNTSVQQTVVLTFVFTVRCFRVLLYITQWIEEASTDQSDYEGKGSVVMSKGELDGHIGFP